jgi:hypothetical protein
MFKPHRSFVGAAVALALAVPFAFPAAATPGKVCYFGECVPNVAPGSTGATPSEPSYRVLVGRHGSWTAVVNGQIEMIVDEFNDGSTFAVATGSGTSALLMNSPKLSLADGQTVHVAITVDGRVFSDTAKALNSTTLVLDDKLHMPDFLRGLYNGHRAHIEAGSYVADMLQLADAKAAIDDIAAYVQTSQR